MLANIHSLLAYDVPRTENVGLPTKFRFNVGPSLQPIAGSMPVNRLQRWPNTNLSPGLLYTLCKHVAFNQCRFNVDPQSSTPTRHWNSIGWLYRVSWLLHYAGVALTSRCRKHQITQNIGPMLLFCWTTVCDAGPTLFQPKRFKLLTTNIIVTIFFWTFVKDKNTQPKDLEPRYIAHVHKDWCT